MVRSYLKGSASAAAVCLALGTAPALAADLPVAVPLEPVVAPVLYSWTGFYYGGHVGAAWRDSRDACSLATEAYDTEDVFGFEEAEEGGDAAKELPVDCETGTIGSTTDGPFEPGTRVDFIDLSHNDTELALAFQRHDDDDDFDLLTGIQVGFNWQAGNLVFGVEADASMVHGDNEEDITLAWYTGETGDPNVLELSDFDGAGTLTIKDTIDWLATLRGRLGVAVGNEGRLLLYGTGGLALAGVDDDLHGMWHNEDTTSDLFTAADSDDDDIEVGFAVGGGVEYAVTQTISVGVEYLGMFFDEDDHDNGRDLILRKESDEDAAVVFSKDGLDDIHTIRGKVNFRFGGFAAAPAVAPAVTTRY